MAAGSRDRPPMLATRRYALWQSHFMRYVDTKPNDEDLRKCILQEARETISSQVVQQTGIQCFNCKEFGHFAKEYRKPKRAKDYTFHKEKMLLCKQAKKGVPLQAEKSDWLENTDEEIDEQEQEQEARYSFMAKIQKVLPTESGFDAEPLEKADQTDKECDDEHLKAKSQDKNIAISELKKLIKKMKGKTVDTKIDKPSAIPQPNALRIPKPSVLGKPTPFLDSLERKSFSKTKLVTKTNVPEGFLKPVTTHILPQTASQAGNDLLTGNRGSDLYTISLQETSSPTLIYFLAKASPTQSRLWHRRLSHLNFDTINLLSKKDIIKEKEDLCILVGYSTSSKRYRVSNKRTRLIVKSIQINFKEIKELLKASNYDNSGLAPQLQKTSDYNSLELRIQDYNNEPSSLKLVLNVSPSTDTNASSLQELEFLFSPLFKEYFTVGNRSVSKSFGLSDNSKQQDIQPTTNIQPSTELTTPTTNVNPEENNTDIQVENAQTDKNEFYNVFSTPVHDEAESSTHNVHHSNMHTFYQRHQSEHQWTKDHPFEQLHGNQSKPVQTRRQLATYPKICMFAVTPPNWVAAEYWVRGVLLHRSITQDIY
uniref:Integrase, catalytic region, zinc finger, CCHC-type, peptidase aspartic, catalytic n=1 Tax=Tanacetum cinerariifolium TaxID=118510 RepID=A0A6L2JDK3_TANCI|nr:integrase, catalytic region, zinc finger, CCHC-type, peptidase aspartic, catalytic [Tanacetum cinerariifolium]